MAPLLFTILCKCGIIIQMTQMGIVNILQRQWRRRYTTCTDSISSPSPRPNTPRSSPSLTCRKSRTALWSETSLESSLAGTTSTTSSSSVSNPFISWLAVVPGLSSSTKVSCSEVPGFLFEGARYFYFFLLFIFNNIFINISVCIIFKFNIVLYVCS